MRHRCVHPPWTLWRDVVAGAAELAHIPPPCSGHKGVSVEREVEHTPVLVGALQMWCQGWRPPRLQWWGTLQTWCQRWRPPCFNAIAPLKISWHNYNKIALEQFSQHFIQLFREQTIGIGIGPKQKTYLHQSSLLFLKYRCHYHPLSLQLCRTCLTEVLLEGSLVMNIPFPRDDVDRW